MEKDQQMQGIAKTKLFVFHVPNAMDMEGHTYTDDVAICYAETKKEAINKFLRLYFNTSEENVEEVAFNDYDIAILTDY